MDQFHTRRKEENQAAISEILPYIGGHIRRLVLLPLREEDQEELKFSTIQKWHCMMSVYLVFLVNIHFNVPSIKKVFSSSTFQRCLLLKTSPAGMWTRKGLFSGKWDLLHGNGQRLQASALFEIMGLQERFLPVVDMCWPFNLTHPLCSQQLSLASCLLCGIMEREGNGIFGYMKWTAVPALTGPGFEPQLSDLLWWSTGSRMAGQGLWRWITHMQE